MNNLSARLTVNDWLIRSGRPALPAEMTYEEFATELRKVTAKTNIQVPFATRADAVAYIRHIASTVRNQLGAKGLE